MADQELSAAARRTVFLVHGRDLAARDAVVGLLRAFDLRVLSWDEAAAETGVATPYTGDVVTAGMSAADGVVVLLTPDDVGCVKEQFRLENDGRGELEPTGQARLNVVFEAGMAMARDREKVVLVELGAVRPMTDTSGLNVVQLEDNMASRRKLAGRLRTAGLAVDLENDDWPTAGHIQAAVEARRATVVFASPSSGDGNGPVEPSAIELLKDYLPDANKRIQLVELVERETASTVGVLAARPSYREHFDATGYEAELNELLQITRPLLQLIVAGVRHDTSSLYSQTWRTTIERLMKVRRAPSEGRFHELLESARHFPALIILRAAGIAAVHSGNDAIFLDIMRNAKWSDWRGNRDREGAATALHDYRVLDSEWLNRLPRWAGSRWIYPASHFLRDELQGEMASIIPDLDDYLLACDQYEYRVALLQKVSAQNYYRVAPGEFIGDRKWTFEDVPEVEVEFRAQIEMAPPDWPWWQVLTNQAQASLVLDDLRQDLVKMRRWS